MMQIGETTSGRYDASTLAEMEASHGDMLAFIDELINIYFENLDENTVRAASLRLKASAIRKKVGLS